MNYSRTMSVGIIVLAAAQAFAQPAVRHATISSGGVVTADGSIIILGQPIAGLACATPTGAPPCIHAGFVPAAAPPECLGDADGDGLVGFPDITDVLRNWGSAGPRGDADGDGVVSFPDITSILRNWLLDCR